MRLLESFKYLIPALLIALALSVCTVGQAFGEGLSVGNYTYDQNTRTLFQALGEISDTATLDYPNVGIHSTPSDVVWGNTFSYAIDGILYSKSSGNNSFTTTDTLPDGKAIMYVYTVDSGGTLATVAGSTVDQGNSPPWPGSIAEDVCAFGAAAVDNNSGSPFTLGTTDYNATGITTTWYNLLGIPSRMLKD